MREATAEELNRRGVPVVKAWKAFAEHGYTCIPCGEIAKWWRQPGRQSFRAELHLMKMSLCEIGTPLFEEWRRAIDDLKALHPRLPAA